MEEKKKDILVGAKVDENLARALRNYIALDTHISTSEFVRDAVREKLEREAEKLGLTLIEMARLPLEELQRRIERRVLMPEGNEGVRSCWGGGRGRLNGYF